MTRKPSPEQVVDRNKRIAPGGDKPSGFAIDTFLWKYGIIVCFIILCVIFSFISPRFLTVSNIINILRQISMLTIVALGMTLVIMTGGIDLSVGSVCSLTGILAFSFGVAKGYGTFTGIAAGMLIGLAVGVINGILVTKAQVMPIIATLAVSLVIQSLEYVYTRGGYPIMAFDIPESYDLIGNGHIWIIPIPVIIMAGVAIVYYLILERSKLGRYWSSIGSREEVATYSGIVVPIYRALSYVICSTSCAITGIILSSRIEMGQPGAGASFTLDAIAASFLGLSMLNGKPSVAGTLIGALMLGVLGNILAILNVSEFFQGIVKGTILLFAVALSTSRKRRLMN